MYLKIYNIIFLIYNYNIYPMKEYLKDCDCAPHLKCNTGCYDLKSLKKFAKAINKVIKSKKDKISLTLSRDKMYNKIKKYFYSKCKDNGRCWLKQPIIKKIIDDNLKYFTFKPEMPSEWKENKYTWLNSLDIYYTMIQTEKSYKDFKFLGPVPSDCPIGVNCELSKLNIYDLLKKNKSKIGIIYNLDVSTGPGTHWTAVYIDTKNSEINYYDSYGQEPIEYIKDFLVKIYKKMCSNGKNPIIIYNDRRHQKGFSECGVFSMNFLFNRLKGLTMYDISNMNITDKEMNDKRKILFR